jgi:hypothetical protein
MKMTVNQVGGYFLGGPEMGRVLGQLFFVELAVRSHDPALADKLKALHDQLDSMPVEIFFREAKPAIEADFDVVEASHV